MVQSSTLVLTILFITFFQITQTTVNASIETPFNDNTTTSADSNTTKTLTGSDSNSLVKVKFNVEPSDSFYQL